MQHSSCEPSGCEAFSVDLGSAVSVWWIVDTAVGLVWTEGGSVGLTS